MNSNDFNPYDTSVFNSELGTTRMVNPDGSMTIRKKIMHRDGTFSFMEQEIQESTQNSKPEQPSFDSKVSDNVPSMQFSGSDSVSTLTHTKMDMSLFSSASSKEDVFSGIDIGSPQRMLNSLSLSARVEEFQRGKDASEQYSIPLSRRVEDYSPSRRKGDISNKKYQQLPTRMSGLNTNGKSRNLLLDFTRTKNSFDTRGENLDDQSHNTPLKKMVSAIERHDGDMKVPPPNNGLNIRESPKDLVYEYDCKKLRDVGSLVDSEGYVKKNFEIEVSVYKQTDSDKIGINVGLINLGLEEGNRLVVTKVSSRGLFAESPIQEGDIVVSINSHQFLSNPKTEHAQTIVREAKGRITIAVQKGLTADGGLLYSPPRQKTKEKIGSEVGKTLTREIWNKDGSLTLVVDQLDENGNRMKREIRRLRMNADNGKIMDTSVDSYSSQGSALFAKVGNKMMEEEKKVEEERTIEKKVVVRKNSRSQKIGLVMDILKVSRNKRSLFVSGIHPSGLIAHAQTSLALGDIILSINGFDFCGNPKLGIANTIILNSMGELTIIAKASDQGFSDDNMTVFTAKAGIKTTTRTSLDFDEVSYGRSKSNGTYNSSKIAKFSKSDPLLKVGLSTMAQITQWGVLLLVSDLSGKAAETELRVGDAILSINGVNFKGQPDPIRAAYILQKATKNVVVEYQRLPQRKISTPFSGSPKKEKGQNKSESEKSRSIEDLDASISMKGNRNGSILTIPEKKSASIGRLNTSFLDPRTTDSSKPSQRLAPQLVPSKSDIFVIRVTKKYQDQEVGISIENVNGILYVSRISLRGILVGKNIIPGDIILSINNKNFVENPNVKAAYSEIKNALKVLIFEVQKPTEELGNNNDEEPRSRWHDRMSCRKKVKEESL